MPTKLTAENASRAASKRAREALRHWQQSITNNVYTANELFQQSVSLYYPNNHTVQQELTHFGQCVAQELLPLVAENNLCPNWPRLNTHDSLGQSTHRVIHHPAYYAVGDIIYHSDLLKLFAQPGSMLKSFCYLYLSGHAGEAGHNCPLACSAGIIRLLQRYPQTPHADFYLSKLLDPNGSTHFTGAQFVTEIQGGSDVGQNATQAYQDNHGIWRINGEKWFCSNADADLVLLTARYDNRIAGTQGLGLFLLPKKMPDGQYNHFTIRRLKNKIGTCSMATGEYDFNDAVAYPVGDVTQGFHILMQHVLHISRLFNTFVVSGMANYAYQVALSYARSRQAFDSRLIDFPLISASLANVITENHAILSGAMATAHLQDQFDLGKCHAKDTELLLRVLANMGKYISAVWSVNHIHHCIDVLGGNGTIEDFSPLPRLLRDSLVCENWEGTHNTLRMQMLRDMLKYQAHQRLIDHVTTILKSLPDDTRKPSLFNFINETRTQCERLCQVPSHVQAIMIQDIFDQLTISYLAVCLLREAKYASSSLGCKKKQYMYDYFYRLHVEKQALNYDDHFFETIAAIHR